jgi:hypothetical protein
MFAMGSFPILPVIPGIAKSKIRVCAIQTAAAMVPPP